MNAGYRVFPTLSRALHATLREASPSALATGLTTALFSCLLHTLRHRVLRPFRRHGLREPHDAQVISHKYANNPRLTGYMQK